MTTFTTEERKNLTEKKEAMPDGSYPIRNRSDLKNAISSYGRAKNKPAVKKWIIRRAKELDCEDLIPESWQEDMKHIDNSEYLIHYGVLGMKWGVRKRLDSHSQIKRYGQNLEKKRQKNIAKIKKLQSKNKTLKTRSVNAIKNSDLELKYRQKTSLGKRIVQNMLFGSTGAETYRLARAQGKNRVKSTVTATQWDKKVKDYNKERRKEQRKNSSYKDF